MAVAVVVLVGNWGAVESYSEVVKKMYLCQSLYSCILYYYSLPSLN